LFFAFYPKYEKPLIVPKDALHLKLITYLDGKPIGREINMPIEELQTRTKTKQAIVLKFFYWAASCIAFLPLQLRLPVL
jgi:hypothetical protein